MQFTAARILGASRMGREHTHRTELRLLLNADETLIPVPLHIGRWTLLESIERAIAYVLEKCGGTLLSDTCDDLVLKIINELEDSKKSDPGDYVREFAKVVESENAHKIFSIVRASISGMSTSEKKRKAA